MNNVALHRSYIHITERKGFNPLNLRLDKIDILGNAIRVMRNTLRKVSKPKNENKLTVVASNSNSSFIVIGSTQHSKNYQFQKLKILGNSIPQPFSPSFFDPLSHTY